MHLFSRIYSSMDLVFVDNKKTFQSYHLTCTVLLVNAPTYWWILKPELLSTALMICVPLCRLDPSPCSIWSSPPGSAGGRPSLPPRATPTASTPVRRQRATPRATKSTVLLQPSRPEPPRSPALRPTTPPPPSKAPTVPLCRTTLSDTLSPPNRAPTLGRWLSMARALGPARRRRGEATKVVCLRRPNVYTGQQGRTVLEIAPFFLSFYRAKRRVCAFFLLDTWEAD